MALPGNTDYQNPTTDTAAAMPGADAAAANAAPSFTPPPAIQGPPTEPDLMPDYQGPTQAPAPKAVDLSGLQNLRNTVTNYSPAPQPQPLDIPLPTTYQQQPTQQQQMPQTADSAITGVPDRPSYATVMDQNGRHHRYSKLQGKYIPVGNTDVTPLGKLVASAYLKHGKR